MIKKDALKETAWLRSAYYGSHIAAAKTAQAFMADSQLVSVALTAYGIGRDSATTLQQLLTQNPNDANSVAQRSPQYTEFAKAFSYFSTLAGRASDDAKNIQKVESAYQANTLKTIVTNEVSLAQAQATRNTNVGASPKAPMNLYQMLAMQTSTVTSAPSASRRSLELRSGSAGGDRRRRRGLHRESLNSTTAIDLLIKRYMANVGAQNAPTSPLLSLFAATPSRTRSSPSISRRSSAPRFRQFNAERQPNRLFVESDLASALRSRFRRA